MKFEKPTRAQVYRMIVYLLLVGAGNACAAAASAFFIVPNDFVMGGVTGLGILVRNLVGEGYEWVVECTVYVANIALFLLGAFLLGKKFALATLAGTLLYPLFLSLFTWLNGLYMEQAGHAVAADDPMLAVVFGALLFGAGLGLVVRVGASTGGTDIPPLILQKYFGIPVSLSLWAIDGVIVLVQLVAAPLDAVLYGIVITILCSVAFEIVSPIGSRRAQVLIVSREYERIRKMILHELNRGATILYGETGYLREDCRMVMTVVSQREVVRLKNEVQRMDPEAFFTVSSVSEVRGRGFTSAQVPLPPAERAEAPQEQPQEKVH